MLNNERAFRRLPVRAALFDLDDTLFDHQHSCRVGLAAIRQEYSCFQRKTLEELERDYSRLLNGLHPLVLQGALTIPEARRERFRRLLAECGENVSDVVVGAVEACYRQAYRGARRAVPGAVPLLESLRSQVKIAVVSNNLAAEQRGKLQCCGLNPLIDELVVAEEVGVSKPDSAIFNVALSRVQCGPQEAVMVGDLWQVDILGAHQAGIRPVWLNRYAFPCPDPSIATEISSFEPLDTVLNLLLGAN